MFRTADGQIQELGDLQLPEGKRIMYQDSQGGLQELSAVAVAGGGAAAAAAAPAAPAGGLSRTALALFLTSPLLVVVGALAVVVLGAVAQRRLRRSAMLYEPISSNQMQTAGFFYDSEASY